MKKNNNIQMPNHPFKTAQDVKRYVRDILLQVQQEETLKKIIDITSKIDYAVIYHLDDDEALTRLYELREKKKREGGRMKIGGGNGFWTQPGKSIALL